MAPKSVLEKAKSRMAYKGLWSPTSALWPLVALPWAPPCPVPSNHTLARSSALWGSWHLLSLLLGSQSPHLPISSSHCLNVILFILEARPTQRAPLKNAARAPFQLCFSPWHRSSNRPRSVYLTIICLHPLKIQYPEDKNLCLYVFLWNSDKNSAWHNTNLSNEWNHNITRSFTFCSRYC